MCHTTKIEATRSGGRFALNSNLQQQRSCIMMHPSGHPAARRQRCSHAQIPSHQPRSVFASTWSLSRACHVRACCVLSLCVVKVENLSSSPFHIRQITFDWEAAWDRLTFFFENDCIAEQVSGSLLGTAEPEGSPAKLTCWERAARATV